MKQSFTLVFALLLLLLAGGGAVYLDVEGHRQQVREALVAKGAINIQVSWDLFGSERGSRTYRVEYEDAAGRRRSTTCELQTWGRSTIYWQDQPWERP